MRFYGPESRKARLLKMGGVSFLIHGALVALFSFAPWDTIIEAQPTVYTVTLTPVSLPPPEPVRAAPPPEPKEEKVKPVKKIREPKKDDIVEKIKTPSKVRSKPLPEKIPQKKYQEEPDEVAEAIKRVQKKIETRPEPKKLEERPPVPPPVTTAAPVTPAPPVPTPPPPSPPRLDSQWEKYYSLVWARIKEEWKIPENVFKEREMVDLETVIVVIIGRGGKIQKYWYDKRSGNSQYDEIAMRAIKRAEPLPDPKELNEDTIEIGLRFSPENYLKLN